MPEEKSFDLITGGGFKEKFASVVKSYFNLIPYTRSNELFEQQEEVQKRINPVAEFYYQVIKGQSVELRTNGKYPEAIAMVKTNLDNLKVQDFDDHDNKAITIVLLRRLGRIYEQWAEIGEADKPDTDLVKKSHFLSAAYYYMLGDIELGLMSEFASRISESLRGAEYFEEACLFDTAFWGSSGIEIEYMDQEGLDSLRKKRKGNVSVTEAKAVQIEQWLDELPENFE